MVTTGSVPVTLVFARPSMQAVADRYYGGSLPRGLRGLLAAPDAGLRLLRDVATAAVSETGSTAVFGQGDPVEMSGFAAVLRRLDDDPGIAERRYLLLLLVWVCPSFATAIGIDDRLWTSFEFECNGAVRRVKGKTVVTRAAAHPIELYHKFVLPVVESE